MAEGAPLRTEDYIQKLQAYLETASVQGDLLVFNQSCHSVAEAAEAAGVRPQDFVKNICLITTEGDLVVAIVKGEDRVDYRLTARTAGTRRVHPASPVEILDKTGFPCGGTPSFGYPARVFVDPRVMEMDVVYTGGGAENALMRVSPSEILRLTDSQVTPVRMGAE